MKECNGLAVRSVRFKIPRERLGDDKAIHLLNYYRLENGKYMNIVTSDLSKFGNRELQEAIYLLHAYLVENPKYLGEGLTLNFNQESGKVFISDEDFNVGMMNGNNLEQFLSCEYCGNEGFASEFKLDENGNCEDCTKVK